MKKLFQYSDERGQGLVEYALILVLVAIVVIGVLLLLGPAVGKVYCQVVNTLQPGNCGVITSVTANRVGNSDNIRVIINVSKPTSVTVTDAQSGASESLDCSVTCTAPNITAGGNAGTVTVTAVEGGVITASYPATH